MLWDRAHSFAIWVFSQLYILLPFLVNQYGFPQSCQSNIFSLPIAYFFKDFQILEYALAKCVLSCKINFIPNLEGFFKLVK